MASTPLLGLALPTDGTTNWGTLVNTSITALLDSAIAGTTTISSTTTPYVLTTTVDAANEARQAIILCTGSRAGLQTIVAPIQSKTYVLINATTGSQAVKIVGVGPTTGVTVPNGRAYMVAWNGSDFVVTGVAVVDLATEVSGVLPPVNGGTGVANNNSATVTSSGNFAYTRTLTAATNVTFPTTGTLATLAGAETLANKTIQARMVVIADATSITINADTTDIATQANTQALGTLTINAPTGTPFNGQKLILRLRSTNVQTFAWNAIFQGSDDVPLPASSSGATKYDYMGFIYNSTTTKWQAIAKNFGF
jgi:hypothetical protein